nr:YadA-like family protein [Collimonas humicola]
MSLSTGLSSLSTGLGQITGISTANAALTPLAAASNNAIANGAALGGTTMGGANADGTVQTRSTAGTAIINVTAATCSHVSGVDATGSGLCAQATKDGATALGSNAQATDFNTTAVGFRALASQAGSVAIGNNAQATGDPTVAIGQNSLASGNNAVAVGATAQAGGVNSVAIGTNAQATGNNSVAVGANSVANEANTLSVGSTGNERRITNVAPGINPTDAVNVSQLQNVQNQVGDVKRIAYSGVAMGAALSGVVMPTVNPGKRGLGVGLGSYQGYNALALQFKQVSTSGNSAWGAGVSTTGQNTVLQIGYGFTW